MSGDKKSLIKIDPSLKAPSHDSCDVYKVNYQYDDKQRKISEEDGRVTHKYTYFEDTSLLSAHYTLYNARIQMRRFYEYDENRVLSKEIIDIESNGAGESQEDLSHVYWLA